MNPYPEYSSPDASSDPEYMARWTQNMMDMPSVSEYPSSPNLGQVAHVGSEYSYWDGNAWILMVDNAA